MGSPLAPVLANLFLGHHENIWLNKYQGPSLQFYRRYVDDTFCLFNNEQELQLWQYEKPDCEAMVIDLFMKATD